MADTNTISGTTPSILMLDQFSRRKKMRLEQAHPMDLSAKPYQLFLKIQWFKVRPISNFTIDLTLNHFIFKKKFVCLGSLDAPVQGASFYVERIDLTSKLR